MPQLNMTEELIKLRDVATRQEIQLHTLSQNYQAMHQMLHQILKCVGGHSAIASTTSNAADIVNASAGSSIRYSVYEQWKKKQKTTPQQLFVDWFLYDLPEGYEEDMRKMTLSATTKSAFKRHKYLLECMLKCSTEYPPPIPDTHQLRLEWEEKLKTMANAALQQIRETLNLDACQQLTQTSIVGNIEYRKKIMNETTLPPNTPIESIFLNNTRKKKRQRDNEETIDV
jgi:hypothetical protein